VAPDKKYPDRGAAAKAAGTVRYLDPAAIRIAGLSYGQKVHRSQACDAEETEATSITLTIPRFPLVRTWTRGERVFSALTPVPGQVDADELRNWIAAATAPPRSATFLLIEHDDRIGHRGLCTSEKNRDERWSLVRSEAGMRAVHAFRARAINLLYGKKAAEPAGNRNQRSRFGADRRRQYVLGSIAGAFCKTGIKM